MKRVLTYLRTTSSSNSTPAAFTESIVGVLQDKTDDLADETRVLCSLVDNCLILSPVSHAMEGNVLRRPTFCPLKLMTSEQVGKLSPFTTRRGVDVGVVVLLVSSDDLVLLTKRPATMRTFPNVWVPPGGHIELGESLEDAGLRELHEETGLLVVPADKERGTKILGFWESAFPPVLCDARLPSRHHIVTYLTVKDTRNAQEINDEIQLDETEVEQCAWVCRHLAAAIVATDQQFGFCASNIAAKICNEKFCSYSCANLDNFKTLGAVVREKKTQKSFVGVSSMLNQYSSDKPCERVSTGTKFALKLWLENNFIISRTDMQ